MKKNLYIFLILLFISNFFIINSDSFSDKKKDDKELFIPLLKIDMQPVCASEKKEQEKIRKKKVDKEKHSFIKLDESKKRVLRELIKHGQAYEILNFYKTNNLNINDSLISNNKQPIFHFLTLKNLEAAKELYNYGIIDINKSPILLSTAAVKSSKDVVKFLLDIGYNPNGINNNSQPPFIRSILHNRLEISQILESNGADINSKHLGKNAMDWAVISKFSQPQTLDFLIERGFEINKNHIKDSVKHGRTQVLKHLMSKSPQLRDVKLTKANLIDIAVSKNGDIEMIKYLNSIGFKIEKRHVKMAQTRFQNAYTSINGSTIICSDKKAEEVYGFILNNT